MWFVCTYLYISRHLINKIYIKILVRNLDRKTTEEELNKLFCTFGDVDSCDLVMDAVRKESKSFAFVVMLNQEEAKIAIKKLNNKSIGNNKVRV
jgi:RNA recognition motif-containing protein